MARFTPALTALFEAYGSDAEAALAAFANTAPDEWSTFVDSAAEKQYRREYQNWAGSHVKQAEKEQLAADAGQARLFELPEPSVKVEFRERLFLDGTEHKLALLTGHKGADILDRYVARTEAPAVTTVGRCRNLRSLAAHIRSESDRLGRPVSAAEVLGWAA